MFARERQIDYIYYRTANVYVRTLRSLLSKKLKNLNLTIGFMSAIRSWILFKILYISPTTLTSLKMRLLGKVFELQFYVFAILIAEYNMKLCSKIQYYHRTHK